MPALKPRHRRHPHQSSSIAFLLLPFLSLLSPILANTEKAIFTAPEPITLSNIPPALDGQNIPVLGPSTRWSIRTNLTRVFPLPQEEIEEEEEGEQGYPSWLLLDNLKPGQRYELRVCWSALQPTAFTLDTYTLSTIFSTPSLLQSLTQHTTSTQQQGDEEGHQQKRSNRPLTAENGSSVLLLRVLAAADYFSHHSSLMKDPPPVLVDLILDPYLYNVLPQSLVPTVCYIVIVSIVSCSGDDDQAKKQN
ncbi:hypothetical protein TASIC1_0010010700 [Trichoderma asperellum]|uniref:Uncharacterized protein n=1 Tax=Trichoderma asperellum TaxID=101201 RepID=A0A6V8R2H6_TRIAP|nr:hypothetical protein TASIC1_0010010700 [Trichoderma asperellum]